jgi:hypothetical protein
MHLSLVFTNGTLEDTKNHGERLLKRINYKSYSLMSVKECGAMYFEERKMFWTNATQH